MSTVTPDRHPLMQPALLYPRGAILRRESPPSSAVEVR